VASGVVVAIYTLPEEHECLSDLFLDAVETRGRGASHGALHLRGLLGLDLASQFTASKAKP